MNPTHPNRMRKIKIINNKTLQRTRNDKMPVQLWEFSMVHEADIISHTPRDNYTGLEGRLPREIIEKNTLNILEYAQFSMYDPI